jgi:3'-phosphoadenosine 5'-phosphosulfate sulfotransferase (PAPS reductase)/FAD synthetase
MLKEIKDSLKQLYLDDPRPWLVGFSGGKDSTLVASPVFEAVLSVPPEQRTKPVTVLCTDTLRRLLAKEDEFSESHCAVGLPDDLLAILKDDLAEHGETAVNLVSLR